MNRRYLGAAGVAFMMYAIGLAAQSTQQPTFRSGTDLVVVDVTVLDRNDPVSGLSANDFRLLDNGVPQQVALDSTGTIPLDVFVLVDTGHLGGWPVRDAGRFWPDVRAVSALLRPGDRMGLATYGTRVSEQLPLQSTPVVLPPRPAACGDFDASADALVQALMRPGPAGRRHMIAEVTNGVDAYSVTPAARLLEVADRSDATVYLVLHRSSLIDISRYKYLLDVTHATGGDVLSANDLVSGFQQVLASLQRSYVLTYVPQGVARTGWHSISVSVTRAGKYDVRARRGYFGR